MPHKTKKEKLLASQRRQRQLELQSSTPEVFHLDSTQKTVVINPPSAQLSLLKKPMNSNNSQVAALTTKFFIGDLRKSLFFIMIIFVLEFFLYFVTVGK